MIEAIISLDMYPAPPYVKEETIPNATSPVSLRFFNYLTCDFVNSLII